MSADGDAPAQHEVVIVRRRGGDGDDGHHGGAWKIAFADLMTAMMAFFLVMWLLNASDKEKIQQIATYFNPMKLNSKRPTAKGVTEAQDVPKAAKSDKVGTAEKQNMADSKDGLKERKGFKAGGDGDRKEGSDKASEEQLFNDPYGVLAKLAEEGNDNNKDAAGQPAKMRESSSGDGFTNPFEPFNDTPPALAPPSGSEASPFSLDDPGQLGTPSHPELPPSEAQAPPAGLPTAPPPAAPETAEKPAEADPAKEAVRKLEGDIMAALKSIAPEERPSIEVTMTSEGLLISLTDDFRFGMFGSASAEPNPDLVVVMEKVGKVLAGRDGQIIVRGHTDARPFKSQRNNNWRLSTARAQIAYHMLVRGGVDEKRFERIEGHADRAPKVPTDPNAAENRRIEILLKVPKV